MKITINSKEYIILNKGNQDVDKDIIKGILKGIDYALDFHGIERHNDRMVELINSALPCGYEVQLLKEEIPLWEF